MGCNFCESKLPCNSNYHAIWYDYELGMNVIKVHSKGCPPYAECSGKNMNITSLFKIKYCPMCGRKFEVSE